MIYVCSKHPWLRFYANEHPYKFAAGKFDSRDLPAEDKVAGEAMLEKLVGGSLGVTHIPVTAYGFRCQTCEAGFQTQAKLDVHLRVHKTTAQIKSESVAEGSRISPTEE